MITVSTKNTRGTPEAVANIKCRRERFLSDEYRQRAEKALGMVAQANKLPAIVDEMLKKYPDSIFIEPVLRDALCVCKKVYALLREGFYPEVVGGMFSCTLGNVSDLGFEFDNKFKQLMHKDECRMFWGTSSKEACVLAYAILKDAAARINLQAPSGFDLEYSTVMLLPLAWYKRQA